MAYQLEMSFEVCHINFKPKCIIDNSYHKLVENLFNKIYFHSDMNLCSNKINLKKE